MNTQVWQLDAIEENGFQAKMKSILSDSWMTTLTILSKSKPKELIWLADSKLLMKDPHSPKIKIVIWMIPISKQDAREGNGFQVRTK
jgi:hypothetical protein